MQLVWQKAISEFSMTKSQTACFSPHITNMSDMFFNHLLQYASFHRNVRQLCRYQKSKL